jgi:hypothetical protein
MIRMAAVVVVAVSVLSGFVPASGATVQGCNASAAATWQPLKGRPYRLEAFSQGPSCARAAVVLVIRAPDGRVVWTHAAAAEHLMVFVEVKTRAQMARALREWLSQSHTFRSTADLPEWKKGAEQPASGEFPFYVEPGIDRDMYEGIRAAKQPVFCYVQGMESMACVVLDKDGQITKVGVQSFPG